MSYIEREAAERAAHMAFVRRNDALQYSEMIHQLAKIPAADVRPVVLCRECIHYRPQQRSKRWSSTTPMCSRSATIKMPPDGFCSFGVKREES